MYCNAQKMKLIMKTGFIYIIKNTINSKVYVGQTTVDLNTRWKEHLRHAKPKAEQVISRAINKYGRENFHMELLEQCQLSKIDEREIYYISKYNSTKTGYNVSLGGQTYKMERPLIDYTILIDLYLNKKLPLEKISEVFKVTRYMITTELRNLGIKIED